MTTADDSPVPDYRKLHSLEGRNYIVLGAGHGIGRQTAHALHQAGARLVCVDVDPQRAEEIAAEVSGIPCTADCTSRAEMQRLVDTAASAMGRIDGVVDIVGIPLWRPILEMDDQHWDSQFDLVLRHAFLATQIAGRHMKEHGGGTLVFIASLSGLAAAPLCAGYGAAKAALISWVQTAAIELAPHGIRVNAVAPGTILTPRVKAMLAHQGKDGSDIPLGRFGDPADIAAAVLFLSTDQSRHVTGRTLVVDGGTDATQPHFS